jgi:DNA replication and repair protein RecF
VTAVSALATSVRVSHLTIENFRNIERADLTFPPEGIAVVGDNGQGKTNLLEALAYLELFRSMRGARDRDLIRFGADTFHVAAEVTSGRAERLGVGVARSGEKRITLDGAVTEKLGDALGAVPSVCVSPSDVVLVSGGPAERRRALDITLALTDAAYLAALRTYRAALDRRNAVLRARRRDRSALHAWEPALASNGATIISARRAWVEEFGARFAALAASIGEKEPMTMRYACPVAEDAEVESQLLAALEASRDSDAQRGFTQTGPHRDDLAISLADRPLRITGSAGQHRTAAIALRLLEAETFRARTGRQPIMLLDDPFAELDARRAASVLALLDDATMGGVGQAVLCVPRAEEIPASFTRLERWQVRSGTFTRGPAGG